MRLARLHRADLLFFAVFAALTALAVAPFWRTTLLPMQDYPQLLVLARAFRDHTDPASPFHGTYTTGFPLSPLVLPLLVLRALAAVTSLETAGRLLWSCHAVALPLSALCLLRALGRDRWAVLLVFPLLFSYWLVAGFFAFATASSLVLFGLALALRWLERPSGARGAALAAVVVATFLWHALAFAQLAFCFGLLWLLWRAPAGRARVNALLPLVPGCSLFVTWLLVAVRGAAMSARPTAYAALADEWPRFFEYIGPVMPGAAAAALLLGLILLAGSLAPAAAPAPGPAPFRVANPFACLSLAAAACFFAFPATTAGVEGIHNRQPWWAALLLVLAWNLPRNRAARAALLGAVGLFGAATLLHMGARFAAFHDETAGASRLVDRLAPGQTLFAPMGAGHSRSFPGKPLIALDQYAAIRHGGLPNTSFAAYDVNYIRYTRTNPMPALWPHGTAWLHHPGLTKFDYVLLRGPPPGGPDAARLILVATDGEWTLAAVCGSRAHPTCAPR